MFHSIIYGAARDRPRPYIVASGLSHVVTVDGVAVDVQIYRLENDAQWTLEVITNEGTSTVWDALFDTDGEALAAFELTVEEEGMEAFFDRGNVMHPAIYAVQRSAS